MENRTAFFGVSSTFSLAGDNEFLEAARLNFGIRNLSGFAEREARGEEETADVAVDSDTADRPKDVGGVTVVVLAFVLVFNFFSEDRGGGGGSGGTGGIVKLSPRRECGIERVWW